MRYLREHWNYLTEPGIYPGVDLLRAIAVTLVVLFHFHFIFVGWVGVDLFFVISGFLIGGIILDKALTGSFVMKAFYWRRALRILPVYYFIILLCALFKATGPFDLVALKSIATGMLFLQTTGPYFFPNVFQVNQSYFVGGSWSLVIEEMFYLIAPVALIFFVKLAKGNLKVVAGLVAMVVVSGVFTRIAMTSSFAPNDFNWHFASFIQFHSRYDELAAGVLAACLVRVAAGEKSHSLWWIAAGTILLSVFLVYMYQHPDYLLKPATFTRETIWIPSLLAAIGLAFLMGSYWWSVHFRPVVVIARLSYPLYLVHVLVLDLANSHANEGFLLWLTETISLQGRFAAMALLSVLLAYIVSLLVEYPFVRAYKGQKYISQEMSSRSSLAS